MSIERVIEKYADATRSDVFARYEKEFAQRISSALSKGYFQNLPEPSLVEIVESVVSGVRDLAMKDDKTHLELSTRSIFIHGNKSQVEFGYYGQKMQRELGDLIFIISVVSKSQKYFEKFTINQFKKDSPRPGSLSWNISNKGQLYLLSRFPTFRGVRRSIIPMKDYSLPNYSGCLGSYGLLYKPGDFAFVSATELDSFIGHKTGLKMNELHSLTHETEKYWLPYSVCFNPFYSSWHLFGNYHHAHNTFDFAHKYLRTSIGEPILMKIGTSNSQARAFVYELISAARTKAQREKSGKLLNFIKGFFRYGYAGNEGEGGFREGVESDFMGGGIGIVHTIINLGE